MRHHDRFQRSQREDALLIVDDFNVITVQGDLLDEVLKYRCRILFNTRSRYEDQVSMEVKGLCENILVELMGKFYGVDRKISIMEEIIALLHGLLLQLNRQHGCWPTVC